MRESNLKEEVEKSLWKSVTEKKRRMNRRARIAIMYFFWRLKFVFRICEVQFSRWNEVAGGEGGLRWF